MATYKRTNWVKWLILVLLLGGSAGAAIWYVNRSKDDIVDFKSSTPSRGDIVQTVTANGLITPVKNVQVGSQISGIIKQVFVDFNDRVSSNQVVAQIDSSTYEQNVGAADAELLNAKAGLELAELNYRRAQSLRSNELIAASESDKTLADLHQAQAVVRMREASLKKAKVDLERTTIYAPINGVVITRNVDVGQTVAASFNTPTLFLIANDLSKMEIDAMVSEADVGGVYDGQPVTFTVEAFTGRTFHGKIRQVRYAPTTNQNVVTYTTVVDVDNEDLKLRPGMTANVSIITSQKNNVLKIPNAALRYRPPEDAMLKPPTNAIERASSTSGNTNRAAEAGATSGGLPDFSGLSREERRKRMESLPPEQQAAMRERMRARFAEGGGGGGGGPGGGAWGGGRPKAETSGGPRTIYLLVKTNDSGREIQKAKPVTVKLGISDGAFTEVLDGLKEDDVIITGQNSPAPQVVTRPPGSSPFGGMGFRPR